MKRPSLPLLFLSAALVVPAARAEDAAPGFDGKWNGAFTSKSGRPRQLELVITGATGTLAYVRQGGKWDDACIGPELPGTVTQRGTGGLTLKIDAESVIKGCGKYTLTIKPGSAPESLVGEFPNGIVVQLTRH